MEAWVWTVIGMGLGVIGMFLILLGTVAGQWISLGNRIDRLDGRMGNRMDRLDGRIGGRMDRLDERMDRLDESMDRLDESIGNLAGRVDACMPAASGGALLGAHQ